MKIITSYFRVPGPAPENDWTARYEDMEAASPVGYGRTEQEAITDLTMNYDAPGVAQIEITPAGLSAMAEFEQAARNELGAT